jgi:hypothetical protein
MVSERLLFVPKVKALSIWLEPNVRWLPTSAGKADLAAPPLHPGNNALVLS